MCLAPYVFVVRERKTMIYFLVLSFQACKLSLQKRSKLYHFYSLFANWTYGSWGQCTWNLGELEIQNSDNF